MNIYHSTKVLPYVYLCTHKETGEFYYGSRCANRTPSNVDLPLYRTSSRRVNPIFTEFNYFIIAEFFDKDSAYDFEQQLIHENWNNPLILNDSCFHNCKRFRAVNGTRGMKFPPPSEETKQKLSAANKGKPRLYVSIALKGKKKSEAHKRALVLSATGRKMSPESIEKARQTSLSKPKLTCPHCKLIGGHGAMIRYHFDHCKHITSASNAN